MSDLFQNHAAKSGPVECLGQTFPSDEARREHYLKLLAEKLKDPAFRKIEGFPLGSDESILSLSDPPYYTACPNPFIEEFVRHYGKSYDPSVSYSKEPFAADVSEGKNDPIYNAHSYHTKVPHKAIMRYILHYTQPGDVVFDGFCGTGMTGIAAQLCGDRSVVTSLGYRVEADGTILEPRQEDGKTTWKAFSKIGARHAVLNDLSTAATFIAYNYNTQVDSLDFDAQAKRVLAEVEKKLGWMYETTHTDGVAKGRINYTVWSDVFTCPECAGEVVFWDAAVDQVGKQILDEFKCPHCSAQITKRSLDRAWTTLFDESIKQTVRQAKQVPVLINYSVGKSRFEKTPDAFDLQLVEKIAAKPVSDWHPSERMMEGGESRRNDPIGMTHVHHFFTQRNLHVISTLMRQVTDEAASPLLKLALLDCFSVLTRMSRFRAPAWFDKSTGPMKGWTAGTLYVPSLQGEQNVFNAFAEKVEMIRRAYKAALKSQCVTTGHNASITMPANSADYVFLDPPFGANINYSELNFLWESWLKVITSNKPEAIDYLKRRPSTYQEVHTDFISQLGAGWKKHESKPELAALLEDNFIQYDGTGEVRSQIHSYLSTNHKDLRGLEKNSPALVAKAKDRWYVPDPNKAQDLEKKREKALLKEFDHYRVFTGRRLKEFRLEALRAGFRAAWGNKDYQTIIDIAKKVPDEALQEDEKLLTLYDMALTRTEDGL